MVNLIANSQVKPFALAVAGAGFAAALEVFESEINIGRGGFS
jgi:hypothetical protein